MSDIENCGTCGTHLDRIRAEIAPIITETGYSGEELVDMLMYRIAPHLHAAVSDAEEGARMVVPEGM